MYEIYYKIFILIETNQNYYKTKKIIYVYYNKMTFF